MDEIKQLQRLGLTVQLRLDEPDKVSIYSATMVLSVPKRKLSETNLTMLKRIAAITSLRPDEVSVENGKLILWWD
jgi:hypothetical protein